MKSFLYSCFSPVNFLVYYIVICEAGTKYIENAAENNTLSIMDEKVTANPLKNADGHRNYEQILSVRNFEHNHSSEVQKDRMNLERGNDGKMQIKFRDHIHGRKGETGTRKIVDYVDTSHEKENQPKKRNGHKMFVIDTGKKWMSGSSITDDIDIAKKQHWVKKQKKKEFMHVSSFESSDSIDKMMNHFRHKKLKKPNRFTPLIIAEKLDEADYVKEVLTKPTELKEVKAHKHEDNHENAKRLEAADNVKERHRKPTKIKEVKAHKHEDNHEKSENEDISENERKHKKTHHEHKHNHGDHKQKTT